eukprot:8591153-Pyramimonas_sp.AAC.1
MAPPEPFWHTHTHHTLRGSRKSSTYCPNGNARMESPHQLRHTPHKFRVPIGSSIQGPSASARMAPAR